MKLCILLIGVIAIGTFSGPQSVSAHVPKGALNLFIAIRSGDVAGVEREANTENVNGFDDLGENSLHIAIPTNNAEIVKILIEKGANVNHLSLDGRSPLQRAKGNKEIEELLRKNGATESGRV